LLTTFGAALLAALAGFAVGGFFVSMAYNELTWLIFGVAAAVDRLSVTMIADAAIESPQAAAPQVGP
jgi:hypothetical protein